jgi:hypothetical protein
MSGWNCDTFRYVPIENTSTATPRGHVSYPLTTSNRIRIMKHTPFSADHPLTCRRSSSCHIVHSPIFISYRRPTHPLSVRRRKLLRVTGGHIATADARHNHVLKLYPRGSRNYRTFQVSFLCGEVFPFVIGWRFLVCRIHRENWVCGRCEGVG